MEFKKAYEALKQGHKKRTLERLLGKRKWNNNNAL